MPPKTNAQRARRNGKYHMPRGAAREALLQSAIVLINKHGVGNVALNDVARHARLNPALVKYYFGSKSRLFQAVLEEVVRLWRSEITLAGSDADLPRAALRQRAKATMSFVRRYPSLTDLVLHQLVTAKTKEARFLIENFVKVNFEEHRRLIQRGIDEGAFRDVDPRFFFISYVASGNLFALALPLMRHVFQSKLSDDDLFEAFTEHAIDMLTFGLGATDPGRDRDVGAKSGRSTRAAAKAST